MLKGLIGKKLGMARVFGPFGKAFAVTVVELGPCAVIQRKSKNRDGYEALQLGYDKLKDSQVNRPLKGHFQAAGQGGFRVLKEFPVEDSSVYELGQTITADALFKVGDRVHVSGVSRGRGFAGSQKRNKFHRGPETHGSTNVRPPGSIGTSALPSRVMKGIRMPGHMGADKVTVKNLQVFDVRAEENLILLKGAVPGAKNGMVVVRMSDYPVKQRS